MTLRAFDYQTAAGPAAEERTHVMAMNRGSRTLGVAWLVAGLLAAAPARAEAPADKAPAPLADAGHTGLSKLPAGTKNLVEVLTASGEFTQTLEAIKTAGMTDTLRGRGPYTLFAPTDDAWHKLSSGARADLLKDGKRLKAVLVYHMVAARIPAIDVAKLRNVKTLSGLPVPIEGEGSLRVGGAKLTRPDLVATNGVVHGIDTVVMPRERSSGKRDKAASAPKPSP